MRIDAHMSWHERHVRNVKLPRNTGSGARRNVAAGAPGRVRRWGTKDKRKPGGLRLLFTAQTGYFFGFSTGYPALTQSANIMSTEVTFVKPSSISVLVASAQRPPDAQ